MHKSFACLHRLQSIYMVSQYSNYIWWRMKQIISIVVNIIHHDHINFVTLYPYSGCHIIHMIYIGYHMEHIIYKVTIYTDLIYTYKIIYGVTLYKSCKECHALCIIYMLSRCKYYINGAIFYRLYT